MLQPTPTPPTPPPPPKALKPKPTALNPEEALQTLKPTALEHQAWNFTRDREPQDRPVEPKTPGALNPYFRV